MAALSPFFAVQFFTDAGVVAAGYKLHTYSTGTTTPKTTYADQNQAAANANPITLDAAGRCALWLAGDGSEYAIELRTPGGALVKRWDDVAGVPAPAGSSYVPLAGGVTMTGRYNLAGSAQSALQPVTLAQMTSAIAAAVDAATATLEASITVGSLPVGAIVPWAAGAIPTGYLALEGGNVSRAGYPDLFALWGVTFGTGDGSTTFGLPDLRGYFLRGWDNSRGVDTGRSLGTFQDDELKSHTHGIRTDDGDGWGLSTTNGQVRATDRGLVVTVLSDASGGGETRPKNFSVRLLVKALL